MVGAAWIGRDGRGPQLRNAVVESAVHRTRRVALTVAATVLAMPLTRSVFRIRWRSPWAALTAATVVTIFFVPTLNAARFKVARTRAPASAATPRLVTEGLSMNPSIVNMRLPRLVDAGELRAMVPGHASVRMDGDCLLPAGGGPVHASLCSHVPEAMRFAASHIEPIEDET